MTLNKTKTSFPLNNNSLSEKKDIINGFESKKYLTKQYTSKSKRHLKTRDKSGKRRTSKKIREKYNIEDKINEDNEISDTLTKSLEEKYCKTPDLTFSSIMDNKIQELHDEWILV
tara:strand:+ start:167 stop:511 length:345 start_codon:yes stop_codon:yes gene_type:complete